MNASRRLAFGSHYPGLIVPARRHGKTFKILFLALDLPAQWLVTVALGIRACHCAFIRGNFGQFLSTLCDTFLLSSKILLTINSQREEFFQRSL